VRNVAHLQAKGIGMSPTSTLPRRVYRAELCRALGFGATWFRTLQQRGTIPQGRRDPGGKREFFTEDEAKSIIERLNSGETAAAPKAKSAKR